MKRRLFEKYREYHFEIKHLLVVFIILLFFQLLVTLIQKISLRNFLVESQEWYQKDFAERLANLTATSTEMILETASQNQTIGEEDAQKIVQAFNIILSQQLLQQYVEEVCILLSINGHICAIDNGHVLFSYLFEENQSLPPPDADHSEAIQMYSRLQEQLRSSEQTSSLLRGSRTFHVFVPFVPKGEYFGALYMRSTPEFGFVTSGILASNNETSMIFSALILFGLLAMFYISSYTVKERDEAQYLLFQAREKQIEEQIHHQKEMQFTRRIYHTHHKAEKVMGFIKEDLRGLTRDNFHEVKDRITRYANFISRVIYDMKWFEPPLQTIRNPVFRTNINDVIRFLVDNIFLRLSTRVNHFTIDLRLDETVPTVQINEFVVWEILEPLIQNCIEHGNQENTVVKITTCYDPGQRLSTICISDNGPGIAEELLCRNERGVRAIFLENVSTKGNKENAGYGCYIAYEIAKQRCGWEVEARNLPSGAQFVLTIPPNLQAEA